jgi:hypothetical protein
MFEQKMAKFLNKPYVVETAKLITQHIFKMQYIYFMDIKINFYACVPTYVRVWQRVDLKV